jgi:hypothetical protein
MRIEMIVCCFIAFQIQLCFVHRGLSILSNHLKCRFAFYPQSFLIPQQLQQFREIAEQSSVWIEKPAHGFCGRGIRIVAGVPDDFTNRGRSVKAESSSKHTGKFTGSESTTCPHYIEFMIATNEED